MRALGHDFVLRCNIRVGFAACGKDSTTFLKWTYGSHHTCLVTHITLMWNALLGWKTIQRLNLGLNLQPVLRVVNSGETFGLVASDNATSFGGLIDIKKEEPHEELLDLILDDSNEVEHILHNLDINPALLSSPTTASISHLDGTGITQHELPSIYPRHTSCAENLETVTRKGLEANLAVIVSDTSCTSVHRDCQPFSPMLTCPNSRT